MATAYTSNARLQKPSTADRNWDVPLNANADFLDGLSAVGRLLVTPSETPSASRNVRVTAGNYVKSDGTIVGYAGTASYGLPASSSTCAWLSDLGVLTSGPLFPTTAHVRLAVVTTSTTEVTTVADERISLRSATGLTTSPGGAGSGVASGPTVASAPAAVLTVDNLSQALGFFGVVPKTQAAALAPLADRTAGAASDAVLDVGPSYTQATLDNNFAALTNKVNALIEALKRHGLMAS